MTDRKAQLAPSLLSADFGRLAEATRLVRDAGLKYLHLDVMDGVFVPPITFGAKAVADLRGEARDLALVCHLMVVHPERHIEDFAAAGADYVTVHAEATPHLHRALEQVRAAGKKAGVALNPATPLCALEHVLDVADLILIMTVNPGFGGQTFVAGGLEKIAQARAMADTREDRRILLEVDGGVKADNVKRVAAAGADIIVAGSAVFGAGNPARAIAKLKEALK
jgi:ribulose-phosphate 3-epimerase